MAVENASPDMLRSSMLRVNSLLARVRPYRILHLSHSPVAILTEKAPMMPFDIVGRQFTERQ